MRIKIVTRNLFGSIFTNLLFLAKAKAAKAGKEKQSTLDQIVALLHPDKIQEVGQKHEDAFNKYIRMDKDNNYGKPSKDLSWDDFQKELGNYMKHHLDQVGGKHENDEQYIGEAISILQEIKDYNHVVAYEEAKEGGLQKVFEKISAQLKDKDSQRYQQGVFAKIDPSDQDAKEGIVKEYLERHGHLLKGSNLEHKDPAELADRYIQIISEHHQRAMSHQRQYAREKK